MPAFLYEPVVPITVPVNFEFPVVTVLEEATEKLLNVTVTGAKSFFAMAMIPATVSPEKNRDLLLPVSVSDCDSEIIAPPLMAYDPVIFPVFGSAWI